MTPRLSPTLLALGLALPPPARPAPKAPSPSCTPPGRRLVVACASSIPSAPMRAQVAGGPAQDIGPSKPATTYAIVKGDQEFKVQVDGKPAGALQVAPDSFTTLGAPRRRQGHAGAHRRQRRRAGRAQGRAALLQPDPGWRGAQGQPARPDAVRRYQTADRRRARHQSVRASLAGARAAASAELALPALQPGDHYSLLGGSRRADVDGSSQRHRSLRQQVREAACAAYSRDDHELFRDQVRRFIAQRSRHTMPPGNGRRHAGSLWRRAGEEGLLNCALPEPYGLGGDFDTRRW